MCHFVLFHFPPRFGAGAVFQNNERMMQNERSVISVCQKFLYFRGFEFSKKGALNADASLMSRADKSWTNWFPFLLQKQIYFSSCCSLALSLYLNFLGKGKP